MALIQKTLNRTCKLLRFQRLPNWKTAIASVQQSSLTPRDPFPCSSKLSPLAPKVDSKQFLPFTPPTSSSQWFNNCLSVQKRNVHSKSEGDGQFIEFLSKEIVGEKQESKPLPSITGFDTVETKGPRVRFIKKINGEIVTVEFDVNDAVTSDEPDALDDESNENKNPAAPEMICQPDFTVMIEKEGLPSKLNIKCQLIDSLVEDGELQEEQDSFEIVELAMTEGGSWDESTYFVNADLLDGPMYDMLMLMLEERGINHIGFCDELLQYSTEYEHKLYVNLLESLQAFMQK